MDEPQSTTISSPTSGHTPRKRAFSSEDPEDPIVSSPSSSSLPVPDRHTSKVRRIEKRPSLTSSDIEVDQVGGSEGIDVDMKGKGRAMEVDVAVVEDEVDEMLSPSPGSVEEEKEVVVLSDVARMADKMEEELWCGVSPLRLTSLPVPTC